MLFHITNDIKNSKIKFQISLLVPFKSFARAMIEQKYLL